MYFLGRIFRCCFASARFTVFQNPSFPSFRVSDSILYFVHLTFYLLAFDFPRCVCPMIDSISSISHRLQGPQKIIYYKPTLIFIHRTDRQITTPNYCDALQYIQYSVYRNLTHGSEPNLVEPTSSKARRFRGLVKLVLMPDTVSPARGTLPAAHVKRPYPGPGRVVATNVCFDCYTGGATGGVIGLLQEIGAVAIPAVCEQFIAASGSILWRVARRFP